MPQSASVKKKFNTLVTKVRTIEPTNAGKKPATSKPGVIAPANQIVMALITNKNKPKDTIVKGKVKITKIGLTTAFTNPNIIAATIAATKLLTTNPGTKCAVISSEIAVSNQVTKNLGITLVTPQLINTEF